MKRIITSTLIILTIGNTFILCTEKAQAQQPQTYCRLPFKGEDSANHVNAYNDGYRQGVESARKGEQYQPRTAGGNFARGFKDGYEGRNLTDSDKLQNTVKCEPLSNERPNESSESGRDLFKEQERQRAMERNQQMNLQQWGIDPDQRLRERQMNRRRVREGLPPLPPKPPKLIPSRSPILPNNNW
jgi:hypothetical protein